MKHQLIELHSQIQALSTQVTAENMLIIAFIFFIGVIFGNHK